MYRFTCLEWFRLSIFLVSKQAVFMATKLIENLVLQVLYTVGNTAFESRLNLKASPPCLLNYATNNISSC